MNNNSIKSIIIPEEDIKQTWFQKYCSWYYNECRYTWHGKIYYDNIVYPIMDFITGLKNFKAWYKIIWKDRNFDHSYILTVLQHKLKLQRKRVMKDNYHYGWEYDARDILICIKLIDKVTEDYYCMEMYDYQESQFEFVPIKDSEDFEIKNDLIWEKLDDYIKLYKATERKVRKLNPNIDFTSKDTLTHYMGDYNQQKANKLLYKILSEKLGEWWT